MFPVKKQRDHEVCRLNCLFKVFFQKSGAIEGKHGQGIKSIVLQLAVISRFLAAPPEKQAAIVFS